jgi:hypothetical protein
MCWVEVCINAYFQQILFKYILEKVYRKARQENQQILAKKSRRRKILAKNVSPKKKN